ncbi:MAG: phosphatidate cytidylyltransferase [Legionella sp.]
MMFKTRLFTTLLLIPIVIFVLFYTSSWVLLTTLILVLTLCAWEWMQLIPIQSLIAKVVWIAVMVASVAFSIHYFDIWLIVGLLFWLLLALPAMLTFPQSKNVWGFPIIVAAVAFLLLPLFAACLVKLYCYHHMHLLLYVLCLVWAADIGAYMAGKGFGNHKLIPQLSPGKTVEGVLGGLAFVMVVALFASSCFHPQYILNWYLIAGIIWFISIVGDLFISMLKRRQQIKDTGSLIPGHGGILDRLDSLIAALPFFYYGVYDLLPPGI